VPVKVESYYRRMQALLRDLPFEEVARIPSGTFALPIFHVGPIGTGPKLLVVAGLNGNEVSASLAALSLLADVRRDPRAYAGSELHLVAPANPAGLLRLSRYNASGCEVAGDFGEFRTPEARALREVLGRVHPLLVVSLHEEPARGFRVVGTEEIPLELLAAIVEAVRREGVPVDSGGFGREAPGGWLGRRSDTLAAFAHANGIGLVKTGAPGKSEDLRLRIAAQLAAVRTAARHLAGQFSSRSEDPLPSRGPGKP
jgi:hypothetical protein